MMRFFKSKLSQASQQDLNNPSHLTNRQNRQPQPNTSQNPRHAHIRAVILGDQGSGKSSLLAAVWPNVKPYTKNPSSFPSYLFTPPPTFADRDSLVITEMPSSPALLGGSATDEIRRSDVVLLAYACSEKDQVDGLERFWIDYLNWLRVKVPIILVGSKSDIMDSALKKDLDKYTGYLMDKYSNIDYSVTCCAHSSRLVLQVFIVAQKSALFPRSPLFDLQLEDLKPEFVIVLRKIFALCDLGCDGCLDRIEFRKFKDAFFIFLDTEARAAIDDFMKELEQERDTLTLKEFVQLFWRLVHDKDYRTVWMIVKAYGFKDELMADYCARQSLPSTSSSRTSSLAPAVAEVNGCLPK